MSNTLAIATVTATIKHVLHDSLAWQPNPVGGADVTTLRPAQLANTSQVPAGRAGLNVYLFQVTPNHAWNLSDLPTRDRGGQLTHRPVAALDLHYLVTAYGNEEALEPQRLLARAVLALTAKPTLTREVVDAAIAKFSVNPTTFLPNSDLTDQAELVKISPTPLSLEELSKLWGALGTPYLLSVAYTATVVLLEAELPTRQALPVQTPLVEVQPFTRVVLDSVRTADDGPPVTGSRLILRGSGLLGTTTWVTIGTTRLAPAADSTPSALSVTLGPDVPAGFHRLQVVQVRPAGIEPERVLARSNGLPVQVLPTVGNVTVAVAAADVQVSVDPPLREGQRATVNFARTSGGLAGDPPLVAAAFPTITGPPVTQLAVPRGRLTAGIWLIRVEVDGAESVPTLSGGVYAAPTVTLP